MLDVIVAYWPYFLIVLSVCSAGLAISHAVMTKDDVRAATGWVGVILLSPILGALVYTVAGINRIRRASIASERTRSGRAEFTRHGQFDVTRALISDLFGDGFASMKTLGDRVTKHAMTSNNAIAVLKDGDEAYASMIDAIEQARRSDILETYIFDRDAIGQRFVAALGGAVRRGVAVRVLVDAVGARYSTPSIVSALRENGVTVELFNGRIIVGLRLPYANLRTHRKIMVVDGAAAFVGGMNIREGFTREFATDHQARDTHFRVTGPIVSDLLKVATDDWQFAAGEMLEGDAWQVEQPPFVSFDAATFIRTIPSGPDESIATNHRMLIGAFSVARKSIRIMSPYFLPDRELISALSTAGRRGVEVDIVVPAENNLTLVDKAMTAQFDQVLRNYCRIWRVQGAFDHSKLLTVDGVWSVVGSSNLDPRSLRLNFEIDVEVMDAGFAVVVSGRIDDAIGNAEQVTIEALRARPFYKRLMERLLWLGSPYL